MIDREYIFRVIINNTENNKVIIRLQKYDMLATLGNVLGYMLPKENIIPHYHYPSIIQNIRKDIKYICTLLAFNNMVDKKDTSSYYISGHIIKNMNITIAKEIEHIKKHGYSTILLGKLREIIHTQSTVDIENTITPLAIITILTDLLIIDKVYSELV